MEGAEMPPYSFQDLRRSEGTFLILLMIQPRAAQRYMAPLDNHDHERLRPGPDEL
jgi:hypothetical protein